MTNISHYESLVSESSIEKSYWCAVRGISKSRAPNKPFTAQARRWWMLKICQSLVLKGAENVDRRIHGNRSWFRWSESSPGARQLYDFVITLNMRFRACSELKLFYFFLPRLCKNRFSSSENIIFYFWRDTPNINFSFIPSLRCNQNRIVKIKHSPFIQFCNREELL